MLAAASSRKASGPPGSQSKGARRSECLPLQSAMTRALRASAAHRRHPAAAWSTQCARICMYACMQCACMHTQCTWRTVSCCYMHRTCSAHAGYMPALQVWRWVGPRRSVGCAGRGGGRQRGQFGRAGRTLQCAHACARTGKAR
jgi:hypothetical protein